jgi:hypothetical protein
VLGESTPVVGETDKVPDSDPNSVVLIAAASYTFAVRGGRCFALAVTSLVLAWGSQFEGPYPPPRKTQTARTYAKSAGMEQSSKTKTASLSGQMPLLSILRV